MTPPPDENYFRSSSASNDGLPSWASKGLQQWLRPFAGGDFLKSTWGGYQDLARAPELIEGRRQLLNEQFSNDIYNPMDSAMRGAVANAFGSGIQNSSMMGDYLARIAQNLGQAGNQAQKSNNIWAQDAELQAQKTRFDAGKTMSALMGDLLGLGRQSSSRQIGASAAVPT